MTVKTELAVRQLLTLDGGVERDRIDRAMRILNGQRPDLSKLMHVVRYREAAAELGVGRRTFLKLVSAGVFVKVNGLGKKALGVTRTSLDAYERGDFERRSLTRHADLAKTDVPTSCGIPWTAQSVFAEVCSVKPMTLVAVRGILAMDKSVRAEDVVRAMRVLDPMGNPGEGDWLSFGDVRELLGIANATLQEMIRKGALVRAYRPPRASAVGVTLDSFLAFSERATGAFRPLLRQPVENAVRFALSKDDTIGREATERFIALLRGEGDGTPPVPAKPSVVSYSEITRRLGIAKRTLDRYARNGSLVRIHGTGSHGIGITRESLLRMTSGCESSVVVKGN